MHSKVDALEKTIRVRKQPAYPQAGKIVMGDAAQIMNRPASSKGAVLVLSDSPAVRDPLVGLLHEGNYSVVECTEDESPSDLVSKLRPNLVLIIRSGSAPRLDRQVRRLLKSSDLPPVIVLGSPLEEIDEGDDQESPVFVRLSREVPPEDQLRVVEAAVKYHELRKDNQMLRSETERLCFDLLRALGETTERLNLRTEEVQRIQNILEDTHARILKAFM